MKKIPGTLYQIEITRSRLEKLNLSLWYRNELILEKSGLSESEIYDIPYDFREKEKHIQKITKEELMDVAKEYLDQEYTLTLLKPK